MKTKFKLVSWGGVAVAALAVGVLAVAAASPLPFTAYAPDGWEWWCRQDEVCVLLPQNTPGRSQLRFLISTREANLDDWLIGWLSTPAGEAEVSWSGTMLTDDLEWEARLGHGNGLQALVAGAGPGHYVGALSDQWSADAPVFNETLKGGPTND
jgi:hypothetical protein